MDLINPVIFWSYVIKTDSCWPWMGTISTQGYGVYHQQRHPYRAHRVAYELTNGPIPAGKVTDHLCRNRGCVNPAHIELVTNKENVLRGVSLSALNRLKTHCKRGHPLSGPNLRIDGAGGRICRKCKYAASKASKERLKLAKEANHE